MIITVYIYLFLKCRIRMCNNASYSLYIFISEMYKYTQLYIENTLIGRIHLQPVRILHIKSRVFFYSLPLKTKTIASI